MARGQNTAWPAVGSSNNVGIGTTTPFARFHVFDGNNTTTGSSVLFQGSVGGTPVNGAGTRFMWIPEKSAFRFGTVSNSINYLGQVINFGQGQNYWDDNNIGEYSFATGLNNRASGFNSHALGALNLVDGITSFAVGISNQLFDSDNSFAFGETNSINEGSGNYIIGKNNQFEASNSLAIGMSNESLGDASVIVGNYNVTEGFQTYAFGRSLYSPKSEVVLLGRNNKAINDNNVAIEFGIGTSQRKNGLTLYYDGSVQFNELPGTGTQLAIDANGFITRTTASGGGGGSLWQTNGSTNEIYYDNDVTVGSPNVNRPQGLKLWVNGSTQTSGLVVNNPIAGWFNDVSQKIQIGSIVNKSFLMWGGDDLMSNDGNNFDFRFQSNIGSGLPWNDPLGQIALSITPSGSLKANESYNQGALNVITAHGNVTIGPKNTSFCHIETNRPRFLMDKPLTINTGQLSSHTNQNLQLQTNNTTRVTILNSNGNVGIGTINPQHSLDVAGNLRVSNAIFIGTNSMVDALDLDARLHIDGKMVCREAVVRPDGWADFVFDENYPLLPLEEVKSFIKANKHLPDVPSEKDVLENGVNVGNMNAILLQKIEELTLYVIQLEEKVNSLGIK